MTALLPAVHSPADAGGGVVLIDGAHVELAVWSPTDEPPARAYLRKLAAGPSRTTTEARLRRVLEILAPGATLDSFPWWLLRWNHVNGVETALRDRGLARETIRVHLAAVGGVLRACRRMGLMTRDQVDDATERDRDPSHRDPPDCRLNDGAVLALFRVCHDDPNRPLGRRDAAMFAVGFGAGLRRGEVVSLTVDQLAEDTGRLRFVGKGDKERRVYLADGPLADVAAWLDIRGRTPGPLFCAVTQTGQVVADAAITPHALYKRLVRRVGQAGVPHAGFHDARRWYAIAQTRRGVDTLLLRDLMGHRSVETTARYVTGREDEKREAARGLHVPGAGVG